VRLSGRADVISRHHFSPRETVIRYFCIALACVASLSTGHAVQAEDYPTKPIRLICPQAAGGPTDFLSRIVAEKLSQSLGQQVVVDNRPGASTMIGAELVARAKPDGYTLLMGTVTTLAINPSLFARMPYDPVTDFEPISVVGLIPFFLIVDNALPVQNVAELVALAKAKPGQLNYGSPGNGTSPHLVGALFLKAAGIDIQHVPYKGTAAALIELEGGLIQMMFDAGALGHIQSGTVRGIGVTTMHRAAAAPDIPTIAEQGFPSFEASLWNGVLAPAGTSKEIVAKLHAAIVQAVNTPDTRQKIEHAGGEPVGGTPAAFAALIKSDTLKWARVVQESGAKID
jgi:tripartite-type tricarboxylate transporter receptor subunit TctC